jgi:hypothetical protein
MTFVKKVKFLNLYWVERQLMIADRESLEIVGLCLLFRWFVKEMNLLLEEWRVSNMILI